MNHTHKFLDKPEQEGFEGLGRKESEEYSGELADTVYYIVRDCEDELCSVSEYRSWSFDITVITVCCEDVYSTEPLESMDISIKDFKSFESPITVELICDYCGSTQTISSDHIYTNLV